MLDTPLNDALVGEAPRNDGKRSWGKDKILCVSAQFAPYFLMWYGFLLVINDLVSTWCEEDLNDCLQEGDATRPLKNVTVSNDMFTCDKLSGSSMGVLIILGGVWAGMVMVVQFILLSIKIGPSQFGSLSLIVWLEVAKERKSIFNICTRLSAIVILVASLYSFIVFLTNFSGNVNDILNVVFQAATSLYTAYMLSTYDSPVTTVFHARRCPDIDLVYPWWQPSEEVISNIHMILALDPVTTESFLIKCGGDAAAMGSLLEEKNLDHLDGDLLASFGNVRNLRIVREYFSQPPTKQDVKLIKQREKEKGGKQGFGSLFEGAGTAPTPPTRTVPMVQKDNCEDNAGLQRKLEEAEREIEYLKSKLFEKESSVQQVVQMPPETPPRPQIVANLKTFAMNNLTAVEYGPAVERVLRRFPADDALYSVVSNEGALLEQLTSNQETTPTPRLWGGRGTSSSPRTPRRPRTPPRTPSPPVLAAAGSAARTSPT